MTRLLAIADLRFREGVAARLAWLVPVAFAIGVATALWARGADGAARAAIADRVVLTSVWGIAFVVAAVVPALGLPTDIRTGSAQTLLSSPVSRFEVIVGGTLGYGALASLLLAAMAGASALGLQMGGVGAGERAPLRPVVAAGVADGTIVNAATPEAEFTFRVPEGLRPGEPLRVRFTPSRVIETRFDPACTAVVSAHRRGQAGELLRVEIKAGTAFTVHIPAGDLTAGEEAILTFRRTTGGSKLVFRAGSVEIGGERRLYTTGLLVAALAATPFLVLLAAIASLAAARFGAPTAVVFASFVFLVFAGRGLLVEAAHYIVRAASDPTMGTEREHDHGHQHIPPAAITPARIAAAKGALALFEVLPRYDTFDRTDSLVERRAPELSDAGRAALEGLPAAALVSLAGWLLFRRREVEPG